MIIRSFVIACLLHTDQSLQEFLRNPDKYVRLGARPPRGVLLVSYIIWFSLDNLSRPLL